MTTNLSWPEADISSTLSATVLVDAVSSSLAMRRDEVSTLRAIERALNEFRAEVAKSRGRILTYTGDGALALFSSITSAIFAALKFQESRQALPNTEIAFRVGIHLGEVFENAERAYGDSLNLTRRVEAAAPAGAVYVSDVVYRLARGRCEFSFEYVGPQPVKNSTEPIELYRVHLGSMALLKAAPREASDGPASPSRSIGDADLPSIAVLPFRNLSGDRQQEYFADGVTDDIITSLSRFRGLDLIARASSFVLRDKQLSVPEMGKRLGARYIAQGSIRRMDKRVRVSIELCSTENDHTIWAEKYDRAIEDIFELQDEIAELVVSVMSVRIEDAERERVTCAMPDSLHAYGFALKGQSHLSNLTPRDILLARDYYQRSVEASPYYARARAGLARANSIDWRYAWSEEADEGLLKALDLASEAVESDPNDARGHAELGFSLLYMKEHDRALASYRRALALNPSDATIIAEMADVLTHAGFSQESLLHFERAMRLNPYYPDQYLWDMAGAYMKLHRYQEAIDCVWRMHNPTQGRRILACCYAHLGRMEDAHRAADLIRAAQPDFTAEKWVDIVPDRRPEDRETLLTGLKAAGL